MRFSKAVVKYRVPILICTLLLMIPSVLGMAGTRVNYDMLNYLPEDMDTVIGQNELLDDFNKGAFSFLILEDMPAKDVAALKAQVEQVNHVETVLWYDSLMDVSVPMELLPDTLYEAFNSEHATMMAVFFDTSTSSDLTMDAIREIRSIAGEQCFVSGMSALVTDLKDLCEVEEPIYVGIAVALACAAMLLLLDSWLVPFVFLASIGMMILMNMGTNYFLGEISYITKALSAVLQLAVTMDYSIFLWNSYNEQRALHGEKGEAMAAAVQATLASVTGSSISLEGKTLWILRGAPLPAGQALGRLIIPPGQQPDIPAKPLLRRGGGPGCVQPRPQRPAVPPAQHRGEHPLRHGVGAGHLPGGRGALGLPRQGGQRPAPAVDGGKQNQLVLRPGHGHIQHPQLLPQILQLVHAG